VGGGGACQGLVLQTQVVAALQGIFHSGQCWAVESGVGKSNKIGWGGTANGSIGMGGCRWLDVKLPQFGGRST